MHTHDVDTKHRKKRPAKKPFVIEYRYVGSTGLYHDQWTTCGKYKTEQQRDQALQNLRSKTMYGKQIFEYRIKQ